MHGEYVGSTLFSRECCVCDVQGQAASDGYDRDIAPRLGNATQYEVQIEVWSEHNTCALDLFCDNSGIGWCLTCTVRLTQAGEAIYLPSGWAHDVISKGLYQSVTYVLRFQVSEKFQPV